MSLADVSPRSWVASSAALALAFALSGCGESRPSGQKAEEAAATNATAEREGAAREVRGTSASTATGSTEPGEAATTTTAPNRREGGTGGPGSAAPGSTPSTLPEETPEPAPKG